LCYLASMTIRNQSLLITYTLFLTKFKNRQTQADPEKGILFI